MGFDSLGRYTPNHKSWDHVGNLIPVVEHSEGIRPHGKFKPAAWLPIQFFDKYYEVNYVALPGKVLAFDNDGRVVPAGLASATSIVYTAADVAAGVIDVTTGVALTAAKTVDLSSDITFMGRTGVDLAVSKPVGVAPYAYFQWAGDGSALDDGFNPAAYREHNHNLQHRVAILCDYVLELPLVPFKQTGEDLDLDSHSGNLATMKALGNIPLAAITARTEPVIGGTSATLKALFVTRVDTLAEVDAAGEWHLDLTTGVITVFTASSPSISANELELDYYHYDTAVTAVSAFACASGPLVAGDFVKCDVNSNFVKASSEDFKDIVGQVLEVENANKDALDKVKTAYNPPLGTDASGSSPGYAGQMDQMPGSATGGVSDKVHYAGAADLVVRINLVSR